MKKEETLRRYVDDFLAERSAEERAEFEKKDIERQYSAVMAWKRRRDLKQAAQESGAEAILTNLGKVRLAIESSKSLTNTDIEKIRIQLNQMTAALVACEKRLIDEEIAELSRQQEEISRRLAKLRGE